MFSEGLYPTQFYFFSIVISNTNHEHAKVRNNLNKNREIQVKILILGSGKEHITYQVSERELFSLVNHSA